MKYCFLVKTPFESILLAAKSNEERTQWKQAILESVNKYNSNILKCSINKITSTSKEKVIGSRKYFVFDRNSMMLQQYSDKESNDIEDTFNIDDSTTMDVLYKYKRLSLNNKNEDSKKSIILQFNKFEEQEFILWHDCFQNIIETNRLNKVKQLLQSQSIGCIKSGVLGMRSSIGDWPQVELMLTNDYIIIRDINEKILEWYSITSDTFIYETTFSAFSFEIVTVKKIIHFSASNEQELNLWINALKSVESNRNDYEDSLVKYALKKCKRDNYYEMTIADAKPLGIVLEKSGENWAIVKSVTSKEHELKLKPAACLASINGENTLFLRYSEVMDRLRDWTPPLTLVFRMARDKKGYLKKRSVSQDESGVSSYSWKNKYCIMTEGKLLFKDDDNINSKQRGEVQLMGASIQFMTYRESGQFYCFRLYSGIMSLVLAASSLNEMIDWASNIHHLICICNGGGHIRAYELDRERLRQERLKAIEEAGSTDNYTDTWKDIEEEEEEEEELDEDNNTKETFQIAAPIIPPVLPPPVVVNINNEEVNIKSDLDDIPPPLPKVDDDIIEETYISKEDTNEEITSISDQDQPIIPPPENNSIKKFEVTYEENKEAVVEEEDDNDEEDYVFINTSNDGNNNDNHVIFVENEQEQVDEEEIDEIVENFNMTPIKETNNNNEVLANEDDLKKVYTFYSKAGIEGMKDAGRYINVMTFSAIWRIVSGEKGNLFQEMQIFNKFDRKKEGYMVEEDFVNGFLNLANDNKSPKESDKGKKYLIKFKKMLGESGDNLLL